jgi:tRNA A37 threonylcarbamoyltransferase TsaD
MVKYISHNNNSISIVNGVMLSESNDIHHLGNVSASKSPGMYGALHKGPGAILLLAM